MTTLKLHNSKIRKREDFVPIDPQNVRMYVCGPTVYDRAHLGNARPVIVFDVLYRLLRHVYGADHVTYVRNFTDVDDKINARSAESGRAIGEITDETIGWFLEDMDAVGALQPDHMPRATAYVPQMIVMIEQLVADGFAYENEGHVLFRVRNYKDYGALSGRSVDDMIAGARVEVAPYKEDPLDFVLWKPSEGNSPGWQSPWGRGRPGWHIECSAMAHELLGAHFDIHGGGNDLMFPHHENEIAQSCCAGDKFANVWLHNEMLQVEGKKMSKSLGNFFTVRDLLEQGVPGEVIRFVVLSTHYRKPMDWTQKKREEAQRTLRKWYALAAAVEQAVPDDLFIGLLADDLNTAGAIAHLHKLANAGEAVALRGGLKMLGLIGDEVPAWLSNAISQQLDDLIRSALDIWHDARAKREWSKADFVRDAFKDAGIRIKGIGKDATWSVERDELDPVPYFHAVRGAFTANDPVQLKIELKKAEAAGVGFADLEHLDVSPAWRGEPSEDHIEGVLRNALLKLKEQ